MKKKNSRIRKPVMKWQTGAYQRNQTFKFELPLPFLMLCKLVNVTPGEMLTDFMDNLSFGSWKREGRDTARSSLADYFIESGYGNERFTTEELRAMFREMDAMGLLFPKDADSETLDSYARWRASHQEYWFDKWSNIDSQRRKPSKSGNI